LVRRETLVVFATVFAEVRCCFAATGAGPRIGNWLCETPLLPEYCGLNYY